jgi:hypothetical protein
MSLRTRPRIRPRLLVALTTACLLAFVALAAEAGSADPMWVARGRAFQGRADTVFTTRARIAMLAADGNRVALVTEKLKKRLCGRIVVWTAPHRRSTSFSLQDLGCRGDGVGAVALGDGQVAWIEEGGGNDLELTLEVARLAGGRPKEAEYVINGDRAGGDPSGEWVGQLLGGGPLLAYNYWTVECDPPSGYSCSDNEPSLRVTNERLVRILAGRKTVVRSGPSSYALKAVGGGRMAVETQGALAVLSPGGSLVSTVPVVAGDSPRAVALSATRLAVERTSTLELLDPTGGAEAKSIPLGPAAALRLVGVSSKLALLRGPRRLVLVRLSDGRLASVPLRPTAAKGIVDAGLTGAGLFYAYNVPRAAARGRVVFEPTARLLARF